MKKLIIPTLILLFSFSFVFADLLPDTDPMRIEGSVMVDGEIGSEVPVLFYVNGVLNELVTTDVDGNYVTTVDGTKGQAVTFKVLGVPTGTSESLVQFAVINKDLDMTKSGSSEACTYGYAWSSDGCENDLTCCSSNTCKSSCSSGGGSGGSSIYVPRNTTNATNATNATGSVNVTDSNSGNASGNYNTTRYLWVDVSELDSFGSVHNGDSIQFNYVNDTTGLNETHFITILKIEGNRVYIKVQSEPQFFWVNLGETITVDVNGNGVKDVYIRLVNIVGNNANFDVWSKEYQAVLDTPVTSTNTSGSDASDNAKGSYLWLWIVLLLVIIAIVIFIVVKKRQNTVV